ncbi:hypothetical protein G7Y89_g916 [Cudoniella acicularis]|uniref:MARVEL domain-containing protein n=1 Tax=Cudoniella acicularis TaxID=354080 RepID=A0A8H4RZ48_9HELO|nr:hypothetical protein G7Y89_g916 [Cudoniella acicularis]
MSLTSFDGDSVMLFTALATIVISVYIFMSSIALPVAYNYWAILSLDIFAIIFWVISFSLLASEIAAYSSYFKTAATYTCTYYYGYCLKKREMDLVPRAITNIYTYLNAMIAAAALGGLEFILFMITLIFTSIYLSRHRAARGHCMPAKIGVPPALSSAVPIMQQVVPQQQHTPQAPQQQPYAPQQQQQSQP